MPVEMMRNVFILRCYRANGLGEMPPTLVE